MKQTQKEWVKDSLFVICGSFLLALSINAFLLPNSIVAGGANGISIVLNALTGVNPAIVLYAINLPLLFFCFILLGKEVGVKTLFGSLIYPFFVGITSHIPTATQNILLASLFGGLLTGLGLGLVFRGKASTGGTAILSQIVSKYLKLPLGISIFLVDGLVILSAFFVFNIDVMMFSLISLFVIGRVVDMVQVGLIRSKNVLIISPKYQQMREELITTLDKGVTMVPIEGGYQQQQSILLMVVIKEKDYSTLKDSILAIDEHAFIVSMHASEVFGKGFSLQKVLEYME